MMRNRSLAAALLSLLAGLSVPGEAPPFRFSREVGVTSPGWNRVEIPLELLRRVPPGTVGMELLDPSGRPVALFPWTPPPPPPPRSYTLTLTGLETVSGGWQAQADLGPEAPVHRRLALDVPGRGLAEGVTLEGSPDGRRWRTLARGSLFRLSYSGETEKTFLEYPPTRDRHLRLFWPEAAGFPRWREVRLEDWPDPEGTGARVQDPVDLSPLPAPTGGSRWRLGLPQRWEGGGTLVFSCAPSSPVTATLLAASGGAWEVRAETVLVPGRPCSLPLPPGDYPGGPVLSFDSGGFPTPPLASVALVQTPKFLLFSASQTGAHTLLYGSAGVAPPNAARVTLPDAPEKLPEATLGPETQRSLPDLPSSALAAGADLPETAFRYKLPLRCEGAAPLQLVRLEIPAEVYGIARGDLGDLRVGWGGKQVPFVLGEPPDPSAALVLRGKTPATVDKGLSAIEWDLPVSGLPLTALEVTAPASPFTRTLTVQVLTRVAPPGGLPRDSWVTVGSATWSCPGVSDLPARCRIPLNPSAGAKMRVTFGDRDNAPLQGLEVVLWRRRHEVVFPWPGPGTVELLAGDPRLGAPQYDLAALREDLLNRPALTALASGAAAREPGGAFSGDGLPGWLRSRGRWVLLGALGAAAVLLLVILGRSIRQAPQSGPPESG